MLVAMALIVVAADDFPGIGIARSGSACAAGLQRSVSLVSALVTSAVGPIAGLAVRRIRLVTSVFLPGLVVPGTGWTGRQTVGDQRQVKRHHDGVVIAHAQGFDEGVVAQAASTVKRAGAGGQMNDAHVGGNGGARSSLKCRVVEPGMNERVALVGFRFFDCRRWLVIRRLRQACSLR